MHSFGVFLFCGGEKLRVIKKINNNVAICIDNSGKELVAFGNGIGFPKTPYNLTNLSKVERTFYGVSPEYMGLLSEIPLSVFSISAQIVDYSTTLITSKMSPNIVFTLSDHINFMIKRYKKHLNVPIPELNNLNYLYPDEFRVGRFGLKLINEELNLHLKKGEIVGIALHFINAEEERPEKKSVSESQILSDCLDIIEHFYKIHISRNGFNYSRFSTHLQFLMKRLQDGSKLYSKNSELLKPLKSKYPKAYECSLLIEQKLEKSFDTKLSEEEIVYLILHINRLQVREKNNKELNK